MIFRPWRAAKQYREESIRWSGRWNSQNRELERERSYFVQLQKINARNVAKLDAVRASCLRVTSIGNPNTPFAQQILDIITNAEVGQVNLVPKFPVSTKHGLRGGPNVSGQ